MKIQTHKGSSFRKFMASSSQNAKKHLRRTMGNHYPDIWGVDKLFCHIETVLNTRTISVMLDNPNEVE